MSPTLVPVIYLASLFFPNNRHLFQLSMSEITGEQLALIIAATTFFEQTMLKRRAFDSKLITVPIMFDECFITFSAFNVGEYRRAATDKYRNHDFFRQDNTEAQAIRQ